MAAKIQRYSRGCGFSYTAGFFPTLCLILRKPELLRLVYASKDAVGTEGLDRILSLVDKSKVIISDEAVAKLGSKGNDHVIGVFNIPEEQALDPEGDHLVMVNPMDMGNVGNAMRTMLAFGYKDLALITPCADCFNPKAIRASMGAFFSIRIAHFPSFEEYISAYPRTFYPFVLQTDRFLSKIERVPAEPIALVFGNEGTGLPEGFRTPDAIRIEQSDEVDSLNLTTSIAVALHDFRYRIKRG